MQNNYDRERKPKKKTAFHTQAKQKLLANK